jgi:hypothetical protein
MAWRIFRGATSITNQTALHPSTSTIAQSVYTFTIPENDEDFLIALFEVEIEQTASSTAQTLTFNITDGATVIRAFTFKSYAALKYDNITFWAIFSKRTSASIQLQLATAGGADANTSIIGKEAVVFSADGGIRR